MSRVMVQTEGLSKIYLKGKVVALEDVNLSVEAGEFLAILGPSGSGKTTLLNIIGSLDKPTKGKVFVDGMDLAKTKNLERFRAARIGFVFQLHNLIPTLSAGENVQLPMYSLRLTSKERRRRAMELLEAVGLKDRVHHTPAMLSGGERQRVAIARALANNPSLVLGDEPTGTLELGRGEEIIELMRGLNRERGVTFILVTHDLNVAKAAQRVVHLINGKIMIEPGRSDCLPVDT
jgi:putative ABC transport system ATP-binding protein